MIRWEYLTQFIKANVKNSDIYVHPKLVEPDSLPKYSPLALMPEMNALGKKGWELMHIQPVRVGTNEDVLINAQDRNWTHSYLCVFKRPL